MGDANPDTREGHLTRLVHHLKGQLNTALANEMWEDAGEINVTIQAVLESAGASTTLTRSGTEGTIDIPAIAQTRKQQR
jgi:hypothetical protein